MREFIRQPALLLIFAVAFSGLSACTESPVSNAETPGNSKSKAAPGGDFPPLVEAAATAEMRHLDGSTSRVADRKGSVVLVNMWATWCGPCRDEMPELITMQDEHRAAGFEVIGLNIDNEPEDLVRPFVDDLKLNYTIAWGTEDMIVALMKVSRSEAIPQSFLIDREGRLRGVFTGASRRSIALMKETVAKVVTGEPTDSVVQAGPGQPANNTAGTESEPANAASETNKR